MLTLLGPASRNFCDGVTRRGFIRLGALGSAITLADVLRATESQPKARKDTAVILWWMGGGPSQNDTYDPKPNAPAEVRGPFGSIPTAAPGMRFSELLPLQAKVADKVAILRSMAHDDNNHPDAAHLVQTGYHEKNVQFRGQFYPAQGAVVAKARGANADGVPPYVCIPDAYFARQGFYQLATYLGQQFDPVNSGSEPAFRFTGPGPSFALPAGITIERAEDRKELLRRLDAASKRAEPAVGGFDAATQKAFDLVTSRAAKDAFDISREPQKLREKYGTNPWGRSALLARRLVEAGVTFVSVNGQTQYIIPALGKVEPVIALMDIGVGSPIVLPPTVARGCGVEFVKGKGFAVAKVSELRLGVVTGPGIKGTRDLVLKDVPVAVTDSEDDRVIWFSAKFVEDYFKDGVFGCGPDGAWRLHGRVKTELLEDPKTRKPVQPKKP